MHASNEFSVELFKTVLDKFTAHDRAVLTSPFQEINEGHLKHEVLTPKSDLDPDIWDICLVSIFNEEVRVGHWTLAIHETDLVSCNIHAEMRRLNMLVNTSRNARRIVEKLTAVKERPALVTIAFIAIAREDGSDTHRELWWHPSFTREEALMTLDKYVHKQLEENE